MWPLIGLGCALLGVALALWRSKSQAATFYEREVYGMTRASHLRFAQISSAFAIAFTLCVFIPKLPAVAFLAAYSVLLILYAATFVRGATGEDE
jgi:hypothetical protein